MGKQKSFQQVLQTFAERLQKLYKIVKFPHMFSSNLYTKSCICYCDFTLKLFLYVLTLICPQVFLPHSRNGCLAVHNLDKQDAACSASPQSFRFIQLGILLSYLKIRKEATFWLQRNPDQPVDNHWFSCFYLATFKKMIKMNVENLWQSSGNKAMENSHLPTLQRQVHHSCEQQKTHSLQLTGK